MTNFFKNFEPRLYQQTICATALKANTLVVLPTGLGKTAISLMLAALKVKQNKKVLILAPTKPLVNQHLESFKKFLNPKFIHEDDLVVFTGMIKPAKRAELWKDTKIIFSTPQGLENDILAKRISLEDVGLIVFDEAHRATGDYSYVWIANEYEKQAKDPLILALTASPGGDREVIEEVCNNLKIEKIEVRDKESPDVKPYVKETKIKWVEVDLPIEFSEILTDLKKISSDLIKLIKDKLKQSNPYININNVSKKHLLGFQAKLQGAIASGEADSEFYQLISTTAQIIKIQHAQELLETQGVFATKTYMNNLWEQGQNSKSKAAINLINNPYFRSALSKIWKISDENIKHPKLIKITQITQDYLKKNPNAKIIIFNNYRDSIKNLKETFDNLNSNRITAKTFVGQSKKKSLGNSQKEQLQIIKDFKENKFNTIIMSSVGEEGLDIPAVDLVLFYEPVPSAIRQIQRAGRTGRQEEGQVQILIAKGTRDVAYRWATQNKQKRMYDVLNQIKGTLTKQEKPKPIQTTLNNLTNSKEKVLEIITDSREKSNKIIKHLMEDQIKITSKQLTVGDYILSEEIGIEFKTKKDFVDSIIDGRLIEQASKLTQLFTKPLIVVQGEEDLYSIRNIHPNSINGVISSLALSFRIPVIFTKTTKETAYLFKSIMKKHQTKKIKEYQLHSTKPKSDKEQQEYIISSLPGVGTSLAKELLSRFGTIEYIINATVEELTEISQLGQTKAEKIKEILKKKYS